MSAATARSARQDWRAGLLFWRFAHGEDELRDREVAMREARGEGGEPVSLSVSKCMPCDGRRCKGATCPYWHRGDGVLNPLMKELDNQARVLGLREKSLRQS